jgi:hypothetical protein
MSVLFLLALLNASRHQRYISRSRAVGHTQASATSPDLKLIIALDHLLSGVIGILSCKPLSSQAKNEVSRDKFPQLIAMPHPQRFYILIFVIDH